jgi:hypothetical protein
VVESSTSCKLGFKALAPSIKDAYTVALNEWLVSLAGELPSPPTLAPFTSPKITCTDPPTGTTGAIANKKRFRLSVKSAAISAADAALIRQAGLRAGSMEALVSKVKAKLSALEIFDANVQTEAWPPSALVYNAQTVTVVGSKACTVWDPANQLAPAAAAQVGDWIWLRLLLWVVCWRPPLNLPS